MNLGKTGHGTMAAVFGVKKEYPGSHRSKSHGRVYTLGIRSPRDIPQILVFVSDVGW
jgi:hypothetical protein